MAAPAYQAIGTLKVGTTDSVPFTVVAPTHITDDVGILFVEMNGNTMSGYPEVWPPTGWDAIGSGFSADMNTALHVACRRAASSSDLSVSLSAVAGSNHIFAIILTYRGCITTGLPYEDSSDNAGDGGSGTTAGISSSGNSPVTLTDALVVCAVSRSDDSAAAHFSSWSGTATPTERYDAGSTTQDGGGLGIADFSITGVSTYSFSVVDSVSQYHAGCIFALKSVPPPSSDSGNFFMFFR